MRRIRKKLRSRRGLTLVETLAAAIVLTMLGLILHTGLLLARQSHDGLTAEAETRLLLSTLADRLSTELRYARDVVTGSGGRLSEYSSITYGEGVSLDDASGQLMVLREGAGDEEDSVWQLLPPGAYGNGDCRLTDCTIQYEDSVFTVHLAVAGRMNVTNETEFQIRCLTSAADRTDETEEASL